MTKLTTFAAALLAATALTAPVGAATVTVTANQSVPGIVAPYYQLGISADKRDQHLAGVYSPDNTGLIQLLRVLGDGAILRYGAGNTEYYPDDQATADAVSAFADALGWVLVVDLPATQGAGFAADQARLWRDTFTVYELANEPNGIGFSPQSWADELNAVYAALPGSVWIGPGTTGDYPLSQAEAWPGLTTAYNQGQMYPSAHYYPLCNSGGPGPDMQTYLNTARALPDAPGWRLDEFGLGICHGGQHGYTDAQASAAYYAMLYISAVVGGGWVGMEQQAVIVPDIWDDGQTRPAYYNMFNQLPDGRWAAAPSFYSAWLISLFADLETYQTTVSGNTAVSAMSAVNPSTGKAQILVVNGNASASESIKLAETFAWTAANVYIVSAPGGCNDTNTSMSGAQIEPNGAGWNGNPISVAKGATFVLPPCGVALAYLH